MVATDLLDLIMSSNTIYKVTYDGIWNKHGERRLKIKISKN